MQKTVVVLLFLATACVQVCSVLKPLTWQKDRDLGLMSLEGKEQSTPRQRGFQEEVNAFRLCILAALTAQLGKSRHCLAVWHSYCEAFAGTHVPRAQQLVADLHLLGSIGPVVKRRRAAKG
eukprot:s315_g10.t1